MDFEAALLACRFGTGLAPGSAGATPAAILAELAGPDAEARARPIDPWDVRVAEALRFNVIRRERSQSDAKRDIFRQFNREMAVKAASEVGTTVARGVIAPIGMRERLMWFWADHFTVTGRNGILRNTITSYWETALRPHLTGRFEDLLIAAVTHPAMVTYLDQAQSVGPGSRVGIRRGGRGLNENLAREILELHTMGVGASYSQTDVTQLAELLTGLRVEKKSGLQQFSRNAAEPGEEVVLGQRFGGDPAKLSDIHEVLRVIARHPDTAAHIARKLVVHFIDDTPPPEVLEAVRQTYEISGGDLMACYRALVMHPDARRPARTKVRRPFEFIVASLRALGLGADGQDASRRVIRESVLNPMTLMGQEWQRAGGPNGWPEAASHWISPQGLAARVDWAMTRPAILKGDLPDPRVFVGDALGPLASPRVRFAADAAEARADGVGLILSSAEFQRR